MKALLFLSFILLSTTLKAAFNQAPPSFFNNGKKMVFIDIQDAKYEITFNHEKRENKVKTLIHFTTSEDGYPLFDVVDEPKNALLNGEEITTPEIMVPRKVTTLRFMNREIKKGNHTLELQTEIPFGIKYEKRGVSAGFFILDLTDRYFLERYLPTNLEYDQYKMDLHVKVEGTDRYHNIFANGEVQEISPFEFKVSYPAYYQSSSVYFHLMPLTKFKRLYFNFISKDGRKIPVRIYSNSWLHNYLMKNKALKTLRELEADYGPFPHPEITIYAYDLTGGMEYPGAAMTSLVSVSHELQHSYFAKGILPANGNAGWIDEAIASWYDKGYKTIKIPFFESHNLGNHSVYTRKTDKDSYKYGRSFMAYLDYKIKENTDKTLKEFLKYYFFKRKYTTITNSDFIDDLEEFTGMKFSDDFDRYIFGKEDKNKIQTENIHHPKFSDEEIFSLI